MNDILVERHWPQPLNEASMWAMLAVADGCLGIHRLVWCSSLLSADGLDLLCHFRGPDAESVRIVMRQMGSPPGRIWSCRIQDAPGVGPGDLAAVNVVVEHRFDAPRRFGAPQMRQVPDLGRLQPDRVRLVRSHLSLDGLRVDDLYQAADAESVRLALQQAGLAPAHMRAVRRFAP
jgi:hypothetical protein